MVAVAILLARDWAGVSAVGALRVPVGDPLLRAHACSPAFELCAIGLILGIVVLALVKRIVVHVARFALVRGRETLRSRRGLQLERLAVHDEWRLQQARGGRNGEPSRHL